MTTLHFSVGIIHSVGCGVYLDLNSLTTALTLLRSWEEKQSRSFWQVQGVFPQSRSSCCPPAWPGGICFGSCLLQGKNVFSWFRWDSSSLISWDSWEADLLSCPCCSQLLPSRGQLCRGEFVPPAAGEGHEHSLGERGWVRQGPLRTRGSGEGQRGEWGGGGQDGRGRSFSGDFYVCSHCRVTWPRCFPLTPPVFFHLGVVCNNTPGHNYGSIADVTNCYKWGTVRGDRTTPPYTPSALGASTSIHRCLNLQPRHWRSISSASLDAVCVSQLQKVDHWLFVINLCVHSNEQCFESQKLLPAIRENQSMPWALNFVVTLPKSSL